ASGGPVHCRSGGRSRRSLRGDRGLGLSAVAAARLQRYGADDVGETRAGTGLAGCIRVLQARGRRQRATDGEAVFGIGPVGFTLCVSLCSLLVSLRPKGPSITVSCPRESRTPLLFEAAASPPL